jgi:hypothetical protein
MDDEDEIVEGTLGQLIDFGSCHLVLRPSRPSRVQVIVILYKVL